MQNRTSLSMFPYDWLLFCSKTQFSYALLDHDEMGKTCLAGLHKGKTTFLEIEGDSKIVIDCYNKRINIPSSIMLLMEDIWKLSQGLHIYECRHVCSEVNRTANCLAKKGIGIIDSCIWQTTFLRIL